MTLRPAALGPLLGLLAALPLSGCGAAPAQRIADHRLSLTLSEYRIVPQVVSVPAGPLQITATNRGLLTHNLALEQGSLDATASERTTLAVIHTLLPGEHGSVLTRPLTPGRYLLMSTVGNQAVLGMSGTLIVR